MNNNLILLTIFVIIFIILMTLLIFYYFNKKETFTSDGKSIDHNYTLTDENNIKMSELKNINDYYLIPNPINMNGEPLMMLDFKEGQSSGDESALTLLRKKRQFRKGFHIRILYCT